MACIGAEPLRVNFARGDFVRESKLILAREIEYAG